MTTVGIDPLADLDRIEADQVPPLDERDAPLRHQPTNVTSVHAEMLSQLVMSSNRGIPSTLSIEAMRSSSKS